MFIRSAFILPLFTFHTTFEFSHSYDEIHRTVKLQLYWITQSHRNFLYSLYSKSIGKSPNPIYIPHLNSPDISFHYTFREKYVYINEQIVFFFVRFSFVVFNLLLFNRFFKWNPEIFQVIGTIITWKLENVN